jgi:V8-like Glu-specific endopeptidase
MMNPETLVEQLKKAVSELDLGQVTAVCSNLKVELPQRAEPFPAKAARSILALLRSKRYFAEMCDVGEALTSHGQRDAKVRRLYAQALIDSGDLSTALQFLRAILDDPETSAAEITEAWGLTGRVHKQSYVNDREASPQKKQETLASAIEAYDHIFDADPEGKLWHGINVVALLARAHRDQIPAPINKDYRRVAESIRETIEGKEEDGNATIWDYSTAMEASIALDDTPAAIEWAEKYVQVGLKGPADEFEFGATLRQLQEVWEANADDSIGQNIVPLLEAALLDVAVRKTKGGSVSLKAEGLPQLRTKESYARLERVFGLDSYKRIQWLRMLMDRCQAIGLVAKRDGTGVGTGFVVNGKSLSPDLDDDWYFLTNSHVVTNDEGVLERAPTHQKPLRPNQAFITFELLFQDEPRQFAVEDVVWTSPPEELDATLLRLDKPFYDGDVEPFPVNSELTDPAESPRIYIAGHPGGRGLTVSLHDNHLLEFDERLMQYRTPTDPGSSGSPVFNDQWELVGLHHAGNQKMNSLNDPTEEREANEGIRIRAIMEDLSG